MAAHRLLEGEMFHPFGRPKPSIDIIDIVSMDPPFAGDPTPEQVMHRLHRAERELVEARRAASKLGLIREQPEVKPESAWEREKRERAERGPAPKTRPQIEMAEMRSRGVSMPSKIEPEDAEARERAVIARFKASTAEQQAAMITEAAARSRPKRK